MTAPTTARPAASGRIVPARKFQREASMSTVANVPPLLNPCISFAVPEILNRKIAEITEPSGLDPCAASRAALRTKKAAKTGTNLPTTTSEMKLVKLVSIPRSQGPLIPAPCEGTLMPCAANQERSWGNVRRITDHNIHLWKRPPTSKLTPL